MGNFKDIKGQSWTIEPLTIGAVLRVKRASEGRFDLLEPAAKTKLNDGMDGPPLFEQLQFDVIAFWELLAFLLEPEITSRSMTAESFGEVMAGDGLMEARDLFFAEWASFFRRLRRPDQGMAMEKTTAYLGKAVKSLEARTRSQEAAIDQAVEAQIEKVLNEEFGNLQASLAAIPGR